MDMDKIYDLFKTRDDFNDLNNFSPNDSDILFKNVRERDKMLLLHNNSELDSKIVSKLQLLSLGT